MSDVPTSAASGGVSEPSYTPPSTGYSGASASDTGSTGYSGGSASDTGSSGGRATQVAQQGGQAAAQAAGDVKDTAAEQARRVVGETKSQVRGLASDVRGRVGEQARTQNDRLVGTIRQAADQLDEMRGDRGDSPAATVVSRVADGGRQFADYLERHGPEGVLREVQDFARRRPGAFLATALAAGFVVGRLGKSVAKADGDAGQKPQTDSYVSRERRSYATDIADTGYGQTGYAATGTGAGTEYAATGTGAEYPATGTGTEYAATGTGTPAVVSEEYGTEGYVPGTSGSTGFPGGTR
jgi:hypothetical protein